MRLSVNLSLQLLSSFRGFLVFSGAEMTNHTHRIMDLSTKLKSVTFEKRNDDHGKDADGKEPEGKKTERKNGEEKDIKDSEGSSKSKLDDPGDTGLGGI